MAIVFPFSVDDKESNSSSGGDGKAKFSSTTVSASNNSNNSATKNVNSNFNDSTTTDKANSSNKSATTLPSSSAPTPNSDQTVTNSAKSIESVSEQAKSNPTKANNCDALSGDVMMNNAIDTSDIKVEIKDDPDAPKAAKSVNNFQPAPGGSQLPPHAANAKHPVSIKATYSFVVMSWRTLFDDSNRHKVLFGGGRRAAGNISVRVCVREYFYNLIKANLTRNHFFHKT